MSTTHSSKSTDKDKQSADRVTHDPSEFAQNMAAATEKSQRILKEFLAKQAESMPSTPIDPLNIGGAFMELFTRLVSDPFRLMEKQVDLWNDYMHLWQNATQRLLGEEPTPIIEPDRKDRRFKDQAWQDNAIFDFLKQSYLLTARWMQQTVNDVSDLDPKHRQKIDFYTRQFVDAFSPTNFLMTNPEVLKATLESNGENLVRGLENMLDDLERGKGRLRISMTDTEAFEVGKNLALTPGKVVYQNDLIQLLQYEPTTEKVYKTPVLFIPAWINKYYIADLKPDNSLIKWLVSQGHTVFCISWVNPNEQLSKKAFDDYLAEGPLAALDVISEITGEESVSAIGYCLGGTLLSITQAWLAHHKQEMRIKSATYLTTMIDFTDSGELSVFIDEEQLRMLEARMSEHGYLEGSEMAMTFNMLRANDLIWSFVVNNYLLGKDPFPFDLLYWNSDCTRMPAIMHSFYLRNMYQKNLLIKAGALKIGGVPIDITKIATPSYLLSTREDHIAPWASTYQATQYYKGDTTFVLAGSGHIAGVINPPTKSKYGYWTNSKTPKDAKEWFASAQEQEGSWWTHWNSWQKKYAGEQCAARKPGSTKKYPALEDAPGSYVKVRV